MTEEKKPVSKIIRLTINHNYGQFSNVVFEGIEVEQGVAVKTAKAMIEKLKKEIPIPAFSGRGNFQQKPVGPKSVVEGEIINSDPERKTKPNGGKAYVGATINVKGIWHYCEAIGDVGETLIKFKKGQIVKISGVVETKTSANSGKEYTTVKHIDAVTLVGQAKQEPPTEQKPTKMPGTDEQGNDLEDIPF